MSSNVQIINPIKFPAWDALVLSTGRYSVFHSSAWARVLNNTYAYQPVYSAILDHGRLVGLMPLMEIRSILTGCRGVSLPFSDHCPSIADTESQFQSLFNEAIVRGKKRGWKYVEWRGGELNFKNAPSYATYYEHSMNLGLTRQDLRSKLRDSTKRNIKKAQKESVKVEVSNDLKAVQSFYQLNNLTRKDHGLPPQPYRFFLRLYDHIIAKQKGIVVLASYHGRPVAGALYVHFGDKALYKYGASDRRFQHLRPNNLVMWEAMKWYQLQGYKVLHLGRTDLDHSGLLQFKRGWGVTERLLRYYRYDLKKDCFVTMDSGHKIPHGLFRSLPSSFGRLAGRLLYRHVG